MLPSFSMSTSFFAFFVLRQPVCRENIDSHHHRRLQRGIIEHLADSDWLKNGYGQNCIITSPTGIGKTYLAYALAQKACRGGSHALYYSPKRFQELSASQVNGRLLILWYKKSR